MTVFRGDVITAQLVDQSGNPYTAGGGGSSSPTVSSAVMMLNAVGVTGPSAPITNTGFGVASIAISGTFAATIAFEGQGADGSWYSIFALQRGVGSFVTSTTSTGLFEVNMRALQAVRVNVTSWTSGAVTAKGEAQALSTGGEFVQLSGNLPPMSNPTLTKIIDINFSLISANSTYTARYTGVTSRNAQARYFLMVNKLNQNSNGNCYLVGYDSQYPKPTYAYAGSQNFGAVNANSVSNYYGSVMAAGANAGVTPFGPTDSIEIQFPMGATAPTSGNVEVWMVELK